MAFVKIGWIWENWKKITNVVFDLIRSGKNNNNKDKETAHLLTMAILSGVGHGKNLGLFSTQELESSMD